MILWYHGGGFFAKSIQTVSLASMLMKSMLVK
jgi:acetyl esterase/lipase